MAPPLRQLTALAQENRRRLDNLVTLPDGEFNVKVTAYDSSSGYYSWTKQIADTATGSYVDDPTGFGGTPTSFPLKERNGAVTGTFPFYAWARVRTNAVGGTPLLEFTMPAARTAGMVRFALAATLATSMTVATSCSILNYWQGADPGTRTTIWNLAVSTNFMFTGLSGAVGVASFDDKQGRYVIIQLQC